MNKPTRDDEIVGFFQSGAYSMAEIGKIYGITRQRVHQILQSRGVSTTQAEERSWRVQAAAEEVTRARALIRLRLRDIIEKYGISYKTLHRELSRQGFDYQARIQAEQEQDRQARVEGRGEVRCRSCGKIKPWGDMRKSRDSRGRPTRQTLCHECNRLLVKAWGRRQKERRR